MLSRVRQTAGRGAGRLVLEGDDGIAGGRSSSEWDEMQRETVAEQFRLISQGGEMAIAESANAARHAVRLLDIFGGREP